MNGIGGIMNGGDIGGGIALDEVVPAINTKTHIR
jgi:hypothetical protein